MKKVTLILHAIREGNPEAADQLLPAVYDELRQMAQVKLARERPGHTLQATALVHEAYLRLSGTFVIPFCRNSILGNRDIPRAKARAPHGRSLLEPRDHSLPLLCWSPRTSLVVSTGIRPFSIKFRYARENTTPHSPGSAKSAAISR